MQPRQPLTRVCIVCMMSVHVHADDDNDDNDDNDDVYRMEYVAILTYNKFAGCAYWFVQKLLFDA